MSSSLIVFQQMLVIFILIAIGYFIYKKKWIGDDGSRAVSFLVLNIANPAAVISSAFSDDIGVTRADILQALLVGAAIYAVLIVFGRLAAPLFGRTTEKRISYEMMSIYANVGFMGIPLITAVIGPQALIYVSIFIILFNILCYSHGYMTMLSGRKNVQYRISWKSFINVGTVSGVFAILVYWFRLRFPVMIEETVTYAGRSATFMAMAVLGFSLAKIPLKNLFNDKQLYLFWAIRYLIFPIAAGFLLRILLGRSLMSGTFAYLLAMPAANMPLMIATQYGLETKTLSAGTFITTVLSIITVTLVSLVI